MTLTVPRAGVIAGAAPSLKVDTPQTGNMIAGLGERMFQIGMQLEDDRLDREAKRLQVDMTRDLGQLRTEFDHMGDPDEIDTLWGPRVTELRDQYLQKADPKNAERIGLIIDDLSERHTFAVGRRSLGLRDSQRLAIWDDYRSVAAQQAVLVDDGTRDMLYQQFDAETDDLAQRGIITPQQAAERRRDFRIEVQNTRIIDQVASDPEGFLTAADAGSYSHLPPEQMAQYRVQADAKIAAREALLIKQADLDTKEQAALIGRRLGEIGSIANAGRVAVDETFMSLPEVQQHPDYPKALAAIALRNEKPEIATLTPAELADLRDAEAANPLHMPWQKDRLDVIDEAIQAAETGWGHDPMAYAEKLGFKIAPIPDLSTAEAGDIAAAIQLRMASAQGMRDAGYVEGVPAPLTLNERAALKKELSVDADPARRAELAAGLMGSGAGSLIEDPVLSHVGGLLVAGGNSDLANRILRGQQVLNHDNVALPPLKDRLDPVFDQIGAIFADAIDGEETQANIIAATDALYASEIRVVDPAGPIKEDTYKQALHEVMGGTGTVGHKDATGGVASINDRLTILPMGTTAKAVEQTQVAVYRDLVGIWADVGSEFVAGRRIEAKDRVTRAQNAIKASSGGGWPTLLGEPMDAEDWKDIEFLAVGPDRYHLIFPTDGGDLAMTDSETGGIFEFSLSSLVRAYRQ